MICKKNNAVMEEIIGLNDNSYLCECGNKSLFSTNKDGYLTCMECGLVYDDSKSFEFRDAQTYTFEEFLSNKRTEVFRSVGMRTVVRGGKDYFHKHLGLEKTKKFRRLSKIHNTSINNAERNYIIAKPCLENLAKNLKINIPDFVQKTAWKIYKQSFHQKLLRGRTIESFCAASLYSAIRMHDIPLTLDDIISVFKINKFSVKKTFSIVVQEVLPKLNYFYSPLSPTSIIQRFSSSLGLSGEAEKKAIDILKNAKDSGLNFLGKDPKGYAASAIYLAGKIMDCKATQEKISSAIGTTELTIRNRNNDLKKFC
ncbi:MAG: hypothetical protein PHT91_00715 [Candidatus Nanoarchaeia archaeon]|nr:hypothetical protein [Candidatus Nanoarchaeia archaeon]